LLFPPHRFLQQPLLKPPGRQLDVGYQQLEQERL
jgi:hypothetical protein